MRVHLERCSIPEAAAIRTALPADFIIVEEGASDIVIAGSSASDEELLALRAGFDGILLLAITAGERELPESFLGVDGDELQHLPYIIRHERRLRYESSVSKASVEKERRLSGVGQLAATLAHEFNNVLMSIMPFAEIIKRRVPGDEKVASATTHIIQAVRRGKAITQEILRFARPPEAIMAAIDLREWLDEFVKTVAAAQDGIQVTVQCDCEGLFILADRGLLSQVASNLVLNAREAMPNGGALAITVRRSKDLADGGSLAEISFADSGRGIPQQLIDRIFDPLFSTKQTGRGLGLAIAYQAMLQQEGSLRVESSPGSGSTFTMVFREAVVPKVEAAPEDVEASKRVLLVEDDVAVGEGICALLTQEGYDVQVIETGAEAVRAIEEFRPSLLVLDMNLPDMSGREVHAAVRARWPRLPVIFSTGQSDADTIADLRRRGIPSVTKPYDFSELLSAIASAQ